MKTNRTLAGLALVALACALWAGFAWLGKEEPTPLTGGVGPGEGARAASTELVETADPEPRAEAEAAASERRSAGSAPVEVAWAGELGGLIGRVVEEDGTPVAGISVALAQVDASLMLASELAATGEEIPELILDETMSDEEGRFRLDGAYDASFQGLGVDLGGPRATVRVIDTQLHHGEVTDVGDIVLRSGCTIFGRVVDEGGGPVAGARVRVVPAPEEVDLEMFLSLGVQDFRADCSVGISKMVVEEGVGQVIELPPIVRSHIDLLPIATTYSDDAGEYRMEGVPIGRLIQGVDRPGLVGMSRSVSTTAGEVELEDAVLTAGRTIQGIVIDDQGEPLQGVEVLAGSEFEFGEAAILHPAGVTGSDGRFSLEGCPETGGVMACARRHPDEAWKGALEAGGTELEIELESAIRITVQVVDAAGSGVTGARVVLRPGIEKEGRGMPMAMMGFLMGIGAPPRPARLAETDPGIYVCDEVTPGSYEVIARPPGLALARKQVELWGGESEVIIVCPVGRTVDVTVTDAATGEGVGDARVSAIGRGFPFIGALAVGRTDREGRVQLGPFSAEAQESPFGMGMGMDGQHVLVQHPHYSDTSVPLGDGQSSLHVGLLRGGEIRGRIVWGPNPPQSIYMLIAQCTDQQGDLIEAFLPPRLGRSSLDGSFRFSNLAAGTYDLEVFDRFLDGDPLMLIFRQEQPTQVASEDGIQVESGGVVEILIDLSPSGRGETARLAGSVFLDGRPVEGAEISVWASGPWVQAETDERGNYETSDFLVQDDVNVQIEGDVQTPNGTLTNITLFSGRVQPTPRSVHRLDVDAHSQTVRVRVTDADGAPIAGAKVRLTSAWRSDVSTDDLGQAEIVAIGEGPHHVTVSADDRMDRTEEVEPDQLARGEELVIVLESAVACAGVCDLSALNLSGDQADVYLHVSGPVDGDWERLDREDLRDDGRTRFELEGLVPGDYKAHVWIRGQDDPDPVEFTLPEEGDSELLLVFTDKT